MAVWQTSKTGQRRKKRLALLLVLLLFLASLFLALAAWQKWFFFAVPAAFQVELPGRKKPDQPAFASRADQAGPLEKKMQELLAEEGFLLQFYRPVSLAGKIPAQKTRTVSLIDQVCYGQYLLEQGKKKAFLNWWSNLWQKWPRPNGFASAFHLDSGPGQDLQAENLAANLALARLLIQSLTLWPDQGRQQQLAQISQLLLADLTSGRAPAEEVQVPVVSKVPDLEATPTPKAQGQAENEELLVLDVLPLYTIDLFALQALASYAKIWQPVYESYLDLVEAGYLDDQLPLYAYAYDPASASYLPYAGSEAFVDTESALLTILHLCESGRVPARSIAWIRDQFYNENSLYSSYHAVQGTAAVQDESVLSYALVARMARIIEDQALYEAAVQKLLWHQVTNPASEAQDLIFDKQADGSALVYARDNVWALLALN